MRAFISCSLAQTEINRKYRRYKLHRNRKLDTTERRRKIVYRKSIKVNHYVGGASAEFQNPMRWSPQSKFHLTGFWNSALAPPT